ncbi:uncharacterized protein [Drosophila takahashii]|uniref:uncharacterized protein n=1 Tax=Drosophila takahashii TaxID=29030 RepID=UPI003898E9FA
MKMYQVHKKESIKTSVFTKKSHIKPTIRAAVFSVSLKSTRTKSMEDCEIIGMIFEIIGDMLFGSDSSSDDDYDSSSST